MSRATAIDCGMLAALEAKEGPPKSYMAEEAVQKRQARRLAECSFKTKLETSKFTPGCLSEKVDTRNDKYIEVYRERTKESGEGRGGGGTPLSPALVV